MKKIMNVFLILCVTVMIGCATENSTFIKGNLAKGRANFIKQNFDDAFIQLYPVARAGNADAQYAIGYMYFYGKGTLPNQKAAYDWMSKAADQGQPDAQKALVTIQHQRETEPGAQNAE